MNGILAAALANPWETLDRVIEEPLHPGGRETTAALLARAGVGPETRVLDVGCGAGHAMELARERGGTAVGVDPSPATDERVVHGVATALPFSDGTVDLLLAECVLCLTDLSTALGEASRVLAATGTLAISDMVVEEGSPDLPTPIADALCLDGARSRQRLRTELAGAGFEVETIDSHHDELLAMRDQLRERIDYKGLLGSMGTSGQEAIDAIGDLEAAVEAGEVSYVSIVARPTDDMCHGSPRTDLADSGRTQGRGATGSDPIGGGPSNPSV